MWYLGRSSRPWTKRRVCEWALLHSECHRQHRLGMCMLSRAVHLPMCQRKHPKLAPDPAEIKAQSHQRCYSVSFANQRSLQVFLPTSKNGVIRRRCFDGRGGEDRSRMKDVPMDSTKRLLKRRRSGGEVVPDSMMSLQLMRKTVRQLSLQRPCRRRYHRGKSSQRDD